MLQPSTICKIDGRAMPDPSSVAVSLSDLEVSAERDGNGYLHRERARQGVRKVSFVYDAMTGDELAALLALLEPIYIHLTYPDPRRGVHTIECYCAQKDGDVYSAVFYNGLWRNVRFNCVER